MPGGKPDSPPDAHNPRNKLKPNYPFISTTYSLVPTISSFLQFPTCPSLACTLVQHRSISSTPLAYIACPRSASVGILFLARSPLSSQSSLAACVRTLHMAYIAYPRGASIGMLFLARRQLSMQSIRLNATLGKVSTICAEYLRNFCTDATYGVASTIHKV